MPAFLLVLGIGLFVMAYAKAREVDRANVRNTLELRADWRALDYQSKIAALVEPVRALALYVAAPQGPEPDLDAEEFRRFAAEVRGTNPISRFSWARWVEGDDRGDFEQAMRRRGMPDFSILARSGDESSALVPAPLARAYAPIVFAATFAPLPVLIGYDLLSDPTRRAAVERARDEGRMVSTPPVRPMGLEGREPYFTVYAAVYNGDVTPASLTERRAQLRGFISGSFPLTSVMSFATANTPAIPETLSLFIDHPEGEAYGVPLVVFRPDSKRIEIGREPLGDAPAGGMRLVRTFEAIGHVRTLVFDFSPAVVSDLTAATWTHLALGVLLMLSVTAYIALEQRRRKTMEAIVTERTSALAESNVALRRENERRELAQAELARTGDQLKAVIDASPVAVVCVDPALRVMIWNRSAERIFGYSATEVVGYRHPLIPDDEREQFDRHFERALAGEVLQDVAARRRCKNGTIIETSYSAAAFHDPAGATLGVVYACEDVTERNRTQSQLLHAQKLETVGQLTGGLAHDFNNILGAVVGNLDLLEPRVVKDETAATYCKEALNAALAGAALVKQMLAFSRRQPLRPKAIDLEGAIANVLPLLTRTLGEHIQIESKLAPGLWRAVADPVQLESALLNLAVNARDAMPDGGVLSIRTANMVVDESFAVAAGDLKAGDYVVLSVADTGRGMPPEVAARVFEPFFTTKGPGKGSGLGLSMVFGTMKQLGGTAKIYSEPEVGTTVRLYLPRSRDEGKLAPAEAAPLPAVATGHERILLVEDNAQIRAVGFKILESLGYRVTVAENGDDAMRHFEAGETFDLLFTDVVMPGRLNGVALAHAVRAINPQMRILFASGFTSPMTVRGDIDSLRADLLLKPYRGADLARLVRTILDAQPEGAA